MASETDGVRVGEEGDCALACVVVYPYIPVAKIHAIHQDEKLARHATEKFVIKCPKLVLSGAPPKIRSNKKPIEFVEYFGEGGDMHILEIYVQGVL